MKHYTRGQIVEALNKFTYTGPKVNIQMLVKQILGIAKLKSAKVGRGHFAKYSEDEAKFILTVARLRLHHGIPISAGHTIMCNKYFIDDFKRTRGHDYKRILNQTEQRHRGRA